MPSFATNIAVANWYRDPDFNAPVVTQSLLGETGTIVDDQDEWLYLEGWDQYRGWVARSQVVVLNQPFTADIFVLDFHGVVEEAGTATPHRIVTYGSRLKTITANPTLLVEFPDGARGHYHGQWTNQTLASTRENIVATARSFLGTPYIWGGRSPWGFDCSGLVQTVFARCGISLPRDAAMQDQVLAAARIAPEEAQPGDLFFFSREARVTHVGFSLGGRTVLHAHGWVKIESLDSNQRTANADLIQRLSATYSIQALLESVRMETKE